VRRDGSERREGIAATLPDGLGRDKHADDRLKPFCRGFEALEE
jgi:hypothetical protein